MSGFIYDGPCVSVIIPVYNVGEKLLVRCIESILQQSYNNLEVVLVDDCSPNEEDKNVEKRYEEQDDRVHVIRHEINQGLFETRITGVEASGGGNIFFLLMQMIIYRLTGFECFCIKQLIQNQI